jgi:Holliday junction resolvase
MCYSCAVTGEATPLRIRIVKSSRHSKIVGSFGEGLVCNWLSRSGFEVSIVDHSGIDLVAYHKASKQRLGISVKSRTRLPNTESESVYIFRRSTDREHLLASCEAFGCEPWLAIYVESACAGELFLTALANYDRKYRAGKNVEGWSMATSQLRRYAGDADIKHVHVDFTVRNWW